jgi:hypothetical protein
LTTLSTRVTSALILARLAALAEGPSGPSPRWRRAADCWLVALALGMAAFVACPKTALAQNNEAIAESLFIEGKQLFSEQKYAEACQKLAQSHKADPAGGTVLLLAMCYERQGRIASAWAKYSEALAVARKDGRADRVAKAQESIDALTPQLAHATVTLSPEAQQTQGMEFELDDVKIPLLIDAKVPVDPGVHRLVVRAEGFEPWTHEFQIAERGELVTITVPALKHQATEEPRPPDVAFPPRQVDVSRRTEPLTQPPALEPRSSGTTRTLGWVIGGVGLATAGVGGYFALKAKSLSSDANDRCPARDCAYADAVDKNHDALDRAKVSTWFVGFGAAALVAGGAMVIFGGAHGPTVTTTAMALPDGGALTISGKY